MPAIAAGLWIVAASGVLLLASRARRSGKDLDRFRSLWAATGLIVAATISVVVLLAHALVDRPAATSIWVGLSVLAVLAAVALGSTAVMAPRAPLALTTAVVGAGITVLVALVYLAVLIGLGRAPTDQEQQILFFSMIAALVVAFLVLPARTRLVAFAGRLAGERQVHASQALETFGARMTRSVPMDELILQLCENLRDTMAPGGAEVWTGTDGQLALAVSVPHRSDERIVLGERERDVAGRARVSGNAWLQVWIPPLLRGPEDELVRVTPAAHQGELLGLIVVRKPGGSAEFTADDDAVLADIGRQLGLALHNVRLDSALQESLERLQQSYVELQASRSRVVAAADESRRRIERNLHDGAQQHLVSIAVKLGLAASIAGDDSPVNGMLVDLRAETQETIQQLRELAHGIYPPLLRQSGLSEALRTAATRNPLDPVVTVDLPGRYSQDVETAIYFCCLEAMQNAAKHAGEGATLTVTIAADDDTITFTVHDNGPGFDIDSAVGGDGFVNMGDRLASVGGDLVLSSSGGEGTSIGGVVPARPLQAPGAGGHVVVPQQASGSNGVAAETNAVLPGPTA